MKALPADREVMHTLSFPTFAGAANDAGVPRRYGGIHFQSGDYAGRGLDRQVAQFVWGGTLKPAPSSRRTR